jgi:hypothetical protein
MVWAPCSEAASILPRWNFRTISFVRTCRQYVRGESRINPLTHVTDQNYDENIGQYEQSQMYCSLSRHDFEFTAPNVLILLGRLSEWVGAPRNISSTLCVTCLCVRVWRLHCRIEFIRFGKIFAYAENSLCCLCTVFNLETALNMN